MLLDLDVRIPYLLETVRVFALLQRRNLCLLFNVILETNTIDHINQHEINGAALLIPKMVDVLHLPIRI